ncbi:hypothetical protein HPP92_020673 [Vanilla planifolia]|uniref:Uncharacterized protein n=1 Tax=Vanilla planifolia TaxID=51239 RepID=A0A835Q389_VANPL|nr:hypothetical protein HPP92_027435 [Vanilla planifolia]KAG0462197.1 hypothetical protein HPP92_020673 [Vanilla planifolia]
MSTWRRPESPRESPMRASVPALRTDPVRTYAVYTHCSSWLPKARDEINAARRGRKTTVKQRAILSVDFLLSDLVSAFSPDLRM